ncbi:MAG: permease-like cell division protein FtsX [Gammaproteobacteria bacterium]|nr:permease-like cell division protein FtsX [Gammaproteobacteria bacterium]
MKSRKQAHDFKMQRAKEHFFKAYLFNHLRSLLFSLGKLYHAPLAHLTTISVIGIALALPTALYALLINAQELSKDWDSPTSISLYLKKSVSDNDAQKLARQLEKREEVVSVRFISSREALSQFRQYPGFGEAIDSLKENPLPSVLVLYIAQKAESEPRLSLFAQQLQELKKVDQMQLDLEWVKRLRAIIAIMHRGVWLIASLLAIAVLLIIGNTIRLDIQSRRAEIEVIKLIGATHSFVRRPFLYGGIWYGLLGGIVALFLVEGGLLLLQNPVHQLTQLYGSQYQLIRLNGVNILSLIMLSTFLGLIGSWLAVRRHLHSVEPH